MLYPGPGRGVGGFLADLVQTEGVWYASCPMRPPWTAPERTSAPGTARITRPASQCRRSKGGMGRHGSACGRGSANAQMLLQARLSRRLSAAEVQQLDEALATALSVLQSGDRAAQQRLLATDMATALLTPAAAQLWAVIVEVAVEGSVSDAAMFGAAVVSGASTIAGVLFASAFGNDDGGV